MLLLILILLLSLYFLVFKASLKENFYGDYIKPWPTRITRPTRNMSYDLRGEAYFHPLLNLPFDNSSIQPIPTPELIYLLNVNCPKNQFASRIKALILNSNIFFIT